MAESFVKQNWLLATMGTLVFIFGGIAGHTFDSRIVMLENWKQDTDISRANRTGELKMETAKALERVAMMKERLDKQDKEIEHLHEDIEKLQRCK